MKPLTMKKGVVKGLCTLMVLVAFTIVATSWPSAYFTDMKMSTLRCVKVAPRGQTNEGIGATLRRNQLALFIAESYSSKVAFPNITSAHGYKIQDLFDSCPTPSAKCTVYLEKMVLFRCPRADCECHRKRMRRYTTGKSQTCRVLQVETDRIRTMEYSGCMKGVLSSYLGTTIRPPVEYDALHYRAGDLANMNGGKSFSSNELLYLLTAMCKLSERDIVVVTEGLPELPKPLNCWNRIVLASDTTVQEAFQIFQHAKTVAVGTSSFATMMMEVASPTHMVLLARTAAVYEWVDCEYWTVIGARGAVFHFDSKKMMTETVLSGAGIKARSQRTKNQEKWNNLKVGVPPRRWTNDSKWIRREKTV